jgi:hypothetical protein
VTGSDPSRRRLLCRLGSDWRPRPPAVSGRSAPAFERAFTTDAVVTGTATANVPDGIDDIGLAYASIEGRPAGPGDSVDVSFSSSCSDDVSDETPDASDETPAPAPPGRASVAARYHVTGRRVP